MSALITYVLPYYNEADWIEATIDSLARQTDRRFALVCVDNASSDAGPAIARAAGERIEDVEVRFLEEREPGKINALRTGISAVTTPFVGTIDADTIYPPQYVAACLSALSGDNVVAALAHGLPPDAVDGLRHRRADLYAALWPDKSHTGGFGQCFSRDDLEAVGGFDPAIWSHVLEDHEVIHRVGKLGRLGYAHDLYCHPSERRADRSNCSWSLSERLLYKLMPQSKMDWFFYQFLGPRLTARGLDNLRLREKTWSDVQGG